MAVGGFRWDLESRISRDLIDRPGAALLIGAKLLVILSYHDVGSSSSS